MDNLEMASRQPVRRVVYHGGKTSLEIRSESDEGKTFARARRIEILDAMFSRGSITFEMKLAGERFQREFEAAGLSCLRAIDPLRPPGRGKEPITDKTERAKEKVREAFNVLGSATSPTGSIAWHCLGMGDSLELWARLYNRGHQTAAGIFIAALGLLVNHYRY